MNDEKEKKDLEITIKNSFYNACELFLERCSPDYKPSPKPKKGGGRRKGGGELGPGGNSSDPTVTNPTVTNPTVTDPTVTDTSTKPVQSVSTVYYTGVDKNNAVKLSKGQTAKMIYKKLDVVTGDSNFTDGLIFNKSKQEGMNLLEHSLSSLRTIIDENILINTTLKYENKNESKIKKDIKN